MVFQSPRSSFDTHKAMVGWSLAWRIDRLKQKRADRKKIGILHFFYFASRNEKKTLVNQIFLIFNLPTNRLHKNISSQSAILKINRQWPNPQIEDCWGWKTIITDTGSNYLTWKAIKVRVKLRNFADLDFDLDPKWGITPIIKILRNSLQNKPNHAWKSGSGCLEP